MICPNCKKEIEQDRYICPHCGSLVAVHNIEMPVFETPIYENKKTDDTPIITIDAKPSDYEERISFSNPKPVTQNNDVYIDNNYTIDYQVKPVEEKKTPVKETSNINPEQVLTNPTVKPIDDKSLLEPFLGSNFQEKQAEPKMENVVKPTPIIQPKENINNINIPSTPIINKSFSDFTPNVEEANTLKSNNSSINEMPISEQFLYEKKGLISNQDKVISLNQQTTGTISDIKSNYKPTPIKEEKVVFNQEQPKTNQMFKDVPLSEYTKEPEVVVHMPEHPRGKLPEEEKIEKRKYSGLLILAIILLLLAGSVFSYYLFLSSKSPTQYQLKNEFVPSITSIVGNRSVKDTKVETKNEEIKKTYKYTNISNVTADLTNYITYLTETLKFINTTTYDLTESSGTIQLGNESKSEGYVILVTITYNSNSYTITAEKKQGTLTRY